MDFTVEHILSAPPERVLEMYTDARYAPAKYRELGLRNVQVVSSRKDEREFQIACRYQRKASIELPKVAQKLVGGAEWLDASQTDTWSIVARTGRLDIVIEAFKSIMTIKAEMKLEAHPQGAINRMRWTVDCSLPLVGGSLAKVLSTDIQQKAAQDGEMAQRLLARYPAL